MGKETDIEILANDAKANRHHEYKDMTEALHSIDLGDPKERQSRRQAYLDAARQVLKDDTALSKTAREMLATFQIDGIDGDGILRIHDAKGRQGRVFLPDSPFNPNGESIKMNDNLRVLHNNGTGVRPMEQREHRPGAESIDSGIAKLSAHVKIHRH